MTRMMLAALLLLAGLAACTTTVSPACDLAAIQTGCPECDDGYVTCTLDDVTVGENSCGQCQARAALYRELCDAGSTVTLEQLEDQAICELLPPPG